MSSQVKPLILVFCAALLMAGCSSAPPKAFPDGTFAPEPELVVPTNLVMTNQPVSVSVPPPPPKTTNVFDYSPTWISLERWCHGYKFVPPVRSVADGVVQYSVTVSNGTIKLQIGTLQASWRGIDLRLGFPPQLIDGHPYLTSLDLRKNFLPLLDPPLLAVTNRVIVIDPGHGGTDTGTRNLYNGHFEKEFTLDWARRVQELLATNGWKVLLTRTNDTEIKLKDRVAFAQEHKADLFISLHFNSSAPDERERGLETYCLTPAGMPSTLTRGYRDNSSLVFPNNQFDLENMQLAAVAHRELLKVNGDQDRGVRRARFLGVLQGQNRPAILIEGGYLSNPREAKNIADPVYREKLAEALALALHKETAVPQPLASTASKLAVVPKEAQVQPHPQPGATKQPSVTDSLKLPASKPQPDKR